MSRRRSGGCSGASVRAAFVILTVALSTVLGTCSVDDISSSNELFASSSSSSPTASSRPARSEQLLLVSSSSLTTVCMQTEATAIHRYDFPFSSFFPCLYCATVCVHARVRQERSRRTPLKMSVEQELDAARAAIQRAARRRRRRRRVVDPAGRGSGNVTTADEWFEAGVDHALVASVYRNPAAFHR